MLAKETKIQNLIHQRNFIKEELTGLKKDGDPSYRYIGYVFPENREYFEKEGYVVTYVSPSEAFQVAKGLPLNIFTPADEISLTAEEENTSSNIATKIENISENISDDAATRFVNDLFSGIFGHTLDDEDSEEEEDSDEEEVPEEE